VKEFSSAKSANFYTIEACVFAIKHFSLAHRAKKTISFRAVKVRPVLFRDRTAPSLRFSKRHKKIRNENII